MPSTARLIAGLLLLTAFNGAPFAAAQDDADDGARVVSPVGGPAAVKRSSDAELLPAEFGPIRQPLHIIESSAELLISMDGFALLPSAPGEPPRAIAVGRVTRANVWAFIVYFWPEILFLILFLGLLVILWRVVRVMRRPQAVGEPICRRCRYQLTGINGEACPECGTKLTPRNRILGRSRRRRLAVPLALGALILSGASVLFYFWYPPLGDYQWGWNSDLSREGSVSSWFIWPSDSLHAWTIEREFWFDSMETMHGQVWLVNLAAGSFERLLLEKLFYGPTGDQWNLFAGADLKIAIDESGVVILAIESESYWFDASSMTVKRLVPDPNADPESRFNSPFLEDRALSARGRYYFDWNTTPQGAWDMKHGAQPVPVPKVFKSDADSRYDFEMLSDEVHAIVGIGNSVKDWNYVIRIVYLWNLETGETRILKGWPEDVSSNGVLSTDGTMLIGENLSRPRDGDIGSWFDLWNLEKGKGPIDLNDTRPEQPIRRQGLLLVAVSKAPKEMFLLEMGEPNKWYAWDVGRNELHERVEPKAEEASRWVREPAVWRKPKVIAQEGSLTRVDFVREIDGLRVDHVATPVQLINPILSDDERFMVATLGHMTVTVFDRQTRRWLGRFDASPHTNEHVGLFGVHIVDNRWLVVRAGMYQSTVLVYDLLQCISDGEPAGEAAQAPASP
ncbi:MAG: hypothetical protein WD768_01595 [Phycisphaeraceae bacterium]